MKSLFFYITSFSILILFVSCGNLKAHKNFTKLESPQVHNFHELASYVGSLQDTNIQYPDNNYMSFYEEDLNNSNRYITILFKHKGNALGGSYCVGRINMDLCKNGIPTKEDADNTKKQVVSFPDICSKTQAILLTPELLNKRNMLNENNLAKDDICIYPGDNLPFNTMTDKDWFRITKEEMDNAIAKY